MPELVCAACQVIVQRVCQRAGPSEMRQLQQTSVSGCGKFYRRVGKAAKLQFREEADRRLRILNQDQKSFVSYGLGNLSTF